MNIRNSLRNIFSNRISPKHAVLMGALVMLIAESVFLKILFNKPHFELVWNVRFLHFLVLIGVIVAAFFIKKGWYKIYGPLLFCLVFVPMMIVQWYSHQAYALSGEIWKPFITFQPLFLGLAVLIPGSYSLNFILMSLLSCEALALWFNLKVNHQPNAIAAGEPYAILTVALVSFCFLMFRYQHERTYRRFMKEKTRSEFTENIARVFLSLRDRSNSPLQALHLLTALIKRKKTIDDDMIAILENSVNELTMITRKIVRYEDKIQWGKRDLMTDEEIDLWLTQIDKQSDEL